MIWSFIILRLSGFFSFPLCSIPSFLLSHLAAVSLNSCIIVGNIESVEQPTCMVLTSSLYCFPRPQALSCKSSQLR